MGKVSEAIHSHHQKLLQTLTEHAAAVSAEGGAEADAAALIKFLKSELLPHASSEERHLYPLLDAVIKTHGRATTTMSLDHEYIGNYVQRIEQIGLALRGVCPAEHLRLAGEMRRLTLKLQALVEVHLAKEERAYLPLFERHVPAVRQKRALAAMHEAYEREKLAGESESAARQAERVVDLRDLGAAEGHARILQMFDELVPGETLILVSDQDPQPLYYQLKFERESEFAWDYIERGPDLWRARIGRALPERLVSF